MYREPILVPWLADTAFGSGWAKITKLGVHRDAQLGLHYTWSEDLGRIRTRNV